jgi:hypothetical protein
MSNAPACRCSEGGRQGPFGVPSRLGAQHHRLPQERRRGRKPGASLDLGRCLLQCGSYVFVRSGGRGGQVPDPAFRIGLGIGRRGERQVGGPAIFRGSGGIGRRPHKRMAEPYPGADFQQLLRTGRGRRVRSQSQLLRGPPQQCGVPGRVGRRQQHELPGWLRQHPDPAQVVVLEPALEVARHAGRGRAGEAARQLGLAHPPGQLQ